MSSRGIGDRIRQCRKKAALSQRDLAYVMHVSQAAVSYWESSGAPACRIPLIAHALGVSVEDLLPSIARSKVKAA
jgi:transcriptional regulator with XRE-family HTH domain